MDSWNLSGNSINSDIEIEINIITNYELRFGILEFMKEVLKNRTKGFTSELLSTVVMSIQTKAKS